MFYSCLLKDGRTATIKSLDLSGLTGVQEVAQLSVIEGSSPFYTAESLDYYQSLIEGQGLVYGLFIEGSMAGYSCVEFSDLGRDNFGYQHKLPRSELRRVALLSGSCLLSAFRGQGLQSAMIHSRIKDSMSLGYKHFFSTVDKGNLASSTNLKKAGFVLTYADQQLPWGLRDIYYLSV